MRHSFLLDENILYHAARGVDKFDRPDQTARELVRSIARICHTLTIHQVLFARYWRIVQKLKAEPASAPETSYFINALMNNYEKRTLEFTELPELPAGVVVPSKDTEIVRAALISRPIVVTADADLLDAVNSQRILGLRALDPTDALNFARQNLPDESQ